MIVILWLSLFSIARMRPMQIVISSASMGMTFTV